MKRRLRNLALFRDYVNEIHELSPPGAAVIDPPRRSPALTPGVSGLPSLDNKEPFPPPSAFPSISPFYRRPIWRPTRFRAAHGTLGIKAHRR